MPSTIPYDPSLVLANVVKKSALEVVESISAAQAPADAAHENLNSLIASKRSLDMTRSELANLGIDTEALDKSLSKLNDDIAKSAADYANAKTTAEATIQPLRAKIQQVHANVESPVDYVKTEIKTLPLASDSINMDVQYFSLDTNKQDSGSYADQISSFVSISASRLGQKASSQMSAAAGSQASRQTQSHNILGTLVFAITCTHKNASILAPFVLNVDKGIKVWNKLFPGDKLNPLDIQQMTQSAESGDVDGDSYSIISGMTFGSSFVGMVHVLNTTETNVTEHMNSIAHSIQAQGTINGLIAKASGGLGNTASFSNEMKNMLSMQNVTSHVSVVSMGVIPSIASSELKMGVKQFADFDPGSSMKAISVLQNATVTDQDTVKTSADYARTGNEMMSLKAANMSSALSTLSDIDKVTNKILDTNSLMNALDDYLKKAADGPSGVPLNYYLKDISKVMLAEMWVSKYFPGQYLAISQDDSGGPVGEPAPTPMSK